jgi:Zn-dependent protease with chaperone function
LCNARGLYLHLFKKDAERRLGMTGETGQNEVHTRKGLILLGIIGIIGLILLAFGVFSIFEISILLGLISLVLGFIIYLIFILIEKKLKLL